MAGAAVGFAIRGGELVVASDGFVLIVVSGGQLGRPPKKRHTPVR